MLFPNPKPTTNQHVSLTRIKDCQYMWVSFMSYRDPAVLGKLFHCKEAFLYNAALCQPCWNSPSSVSLIKRQRVGSSPTPFAFRSVCSNFSQGCFWVFSNKTKERVGRECHRFLCIWIMFENVFLLQVLEDANWDFSHFSRALGSVSNQMTKWVIHTQLTER